MLEGGSFICTESSSSWIEGKWTFGYLNEREWWWWWGMRILMVSDVMWSLAYLNENWSGRSLVLFQSETQFRNTTMGWDDDVDDVWPPQHTHNRGPMFDNYMKRPGYRLEWALARTRDSRRENSLWNQSPLTTKAIRAKASRAGSIQGQTIIQCNNRLASPRPASTSSSLFNPTQISRGREKSNCGLRTRTRTWTNR